jgi:superfamily II DNA or RNA helicase
MSIILPVDVLTLDMVDLVRNHLNLVPKPSDFVLKSNQYRPKKEEIMFYKVDGKNLIIPYMFGKCLILKRTTENQQLKEKILSLFHIDYLPIQSIFTGQLFTHQIPVYEKALEQLRLHNTTTIGLYPGFGKTIVGAKITTELKLKTVVLFHRQILITQWEKTFTDFTTCKCAIVGKDSDENLYQADVLLCMDTRYYLIPKELRSRIGTMIIDEAHAFCTPSHVDCLLSFTPKYVISETATLLRKDEMHKMIYSICGTHGIYKISSSPFKVHRIDTELAIEAGKNIRGDLDYTSLITNKIQNQKRNEMILEAIHYFPNRKILILSSRKEHLQMLYEPIKERPDLYGTVDTLYGTKKDYSDSRILLGSIPKVGTGFDEKTLCKNFGGQRLDVLFLVTSFKELSILEQCVGRVFRADNPVVVDFVDNHTIFKRHFSERSKWYVSRNGTIEVSHFVDGKLQPKKNVRVRKPKQKDESTQNTDNKKNDTKIITNNDEEEDLDKPSGPVFSINGKQLSN